MMKIYFFFSSLTSLRLAVNWKIKQNLYRAFVVKRKAKMEKSLIIKTLKVSSIASLYT